MITQELVLFIKQQLQEGKSKEQIAQLLVPHGWQLEDINSVFTQIMPSAQPVQPLAPVVEVREPVMATQQTVTANQMNQSSIAPMTGSLLDSLKNPSALVAGIAIIVASIASTLIAFYVQMNQGGIKAVGSLVNQNTLIGGILGIMVVGLIMNGLVTKLVTKILSIEPRTFAKAFVFVSISLIATSLLTLTILVGVPAYIITIPGIIIWLVLFWYYYQSGIAKAIGAFFLNMIVGAVVAGIGFLIALALGIGFISNLGNLLKGIPTNQAHKEVVTIPMVQPVIPENNQITDAQGVVPVSTDTGMIPDAQSISSSSVTTTSDAAIINPELSHVKDAFPVGFPLPSDQEVIAATVLSATNFEGIRYILNYTSAHSVAYLRNAMKAALEKAGYVVSINETNQDYRVITASKVVRNTARTFSIIIEKTVLGATISTVFTQ